VVIISQAIGLAIDLFICYNKIYKRPDGQSLKEALEALAAAGRIPKEWADAYGRIYRSFRNDYHHMNPQVGKLDHHALAHRNMQDLAYLESEMFAIDGTIDGKIVLRHIDFWDRQSDGTVKAHLNLE
jgi:hypothetical protein